MRDIRSPLNISETVRDRGLVKNGPPTGNGLYGKANDRVTDDVTLF